MSEYPDIIVYIKRLIDLAQGQPLQRRARACLKNLWLFGLKCLYMAATDSPVVPACSASVTPPTKPITAPPARPAENCWPIGRYRAY